MARFLIFVLMSGCCSKDYEVYGIDVYLVDGVRPTRERMMEATDFFIWSVADFFTEPESKIKRAIKLVKTIEWYEKPIEYGGELYSGLYSGSNIKVLYFGCIYKSAYYHEYLHHIAYVLAIDDDVDEEDGSLNNLNRLLKSTAYTLYGCGENNGKDS